MSNLSIYKFLAMTGMIGLMCQSKLYDFPKIPNYGRSISAGSVTDYDYHKKGLHKWKINGEYQVFAKNERDARKRAGTKGLTPIQTIEMVD